MENIEYKRAGWRWKEGRKDRAGGRQKGKGKVRWKGRKGYLCSFDTSKFKHLFSVLSFSDTFINEMHDFFDNFKGRSKIIVIRVGRFCFC